MAWKQRLEIIREIATILGLIAVPILIAYQGGRIQSEIADASIKKEYVQLALGILQSTERKDDTQYTKLRDWSLELINKFAPVPLPAETTAEGLPYLGQGGHLWMRGLAAEIAPSPSNSCAEYYIITGDMDGVKKCLEQIRADQKQKK